MARFLDMPGASSASAGFSTGKKERTGGRSRPPDEPGLVTPRGFVMSLAMTNCGGVRAGTDRPGYRYGQPWPALPDAVLATAIEATKEAGYPDFVPDACLINRYEPGARLSLHRDKNEVDFKNPIVSVSLGLPATFQSGGIKRTDPIRRYALRHGDIAVWGGPSRLFYHGVQPLKDGMYDKTWPHADQSYVSQRAVSDRGVTMTAGLRGEQRRRKVCGTAATCGCPAEQVHDDPAKALVMSHLRRLVRNGFAVWVALSNGDVESTLSSGEVFHRGEETVTAHVSRRSQIALAALWFPPGMSARR
jgi:DNA alkylation damage repair protein AlkB